MTPYQQSAIEQIDSFLDQWGKLRPLVDDFSASKMTDYFEDTHALDARIDAIFERLVPPNSSYAKSINDLESIKPNYHLVAKVGILKSLRADYEGGYFRRVDEIVRAEVFNDFLEMAEHLLSEGYKDAAAVMIGGVLEDHLRKLAIKNGISTTVSTASGVAPKKRDAINADLYRQKVYSLLDQKSVTAWLDLRNNAAHGNHSVYSAEQVILTLQGVRNFIVRIPA